MSIYLDNAATTPLDPEVFDAMRPYLVEDFGNPSSTHSHGRKVRAAIETSRKKVAELLNCTPGEIIFTSGGTEADNTILTSAAERYQLKHMIISPLEHHAVLHTAEHLAHQGLAEIHWLHPDPKGFIDLDELQTLLKAYPSSLVSLMHANNEIGNLLDLKKAAALCNEYNAYFHSDTVQTVGHYRHDAKDLQVCAMTAAAHKFHGPKGIGFMYIRKDKKINPLVHGGSQERNMRGGTENVYGIVGLAKALEIAYRDLEEHKQYISKLKGEMIALLQDQIPGVQFNGASEDLDRSLYTVLNVSLPEGEGQDMLLFNLDLKGISVSGGSACSSGALQGSHVLNTLYPDSRRGAVRFSFSKYNTREEIATAVDALSALVRVNV